MIDKRSEAVARRLRKSYITECLAKKHGAKIQKPKEKVRVWIDEYQEHIHNRVPK